MLLSAALIVKNEEKFLEACLSSLKDIVDEVVVVDTSSTDRSQEIAREAGAHLHEFAWVNDFSAARNRALDLARGEWILYIDADERVAPCAPSALRTLLSDPSYVGYYVRLHPRPGFTPYWEMRLFRNDPGIRFRGVVHENIWPAIHEYRAARGGKIGRSGLVLHHEGYEGDQRAKHRRNLPLLHEALRQDPERVFCWCHLANTYLALGKERRAEKAWEVALAVVRKKSKRLPEDVLPYIGLIQLVSGKGRDVSALLNEAMDRFPQNHQLRWVQGRALMRDGRYQDAIPVFERLVACGETGDYDRGASYDTRLFEVLSYESLAACHFRLGHSADSRRYYELAARCEPDKLEYRVKQELCSQLERSHAGPPGGVA